MKLATMIAILALAGKCSLQELSTVVTGLALQTAMLLRCNGSAAAATAAAAAAMLLCAAPPSTASIAGQARTQTACPKRDQATNFIAPCSGLSQYNNSTAAGCYQCCGQQPSGPSQQHNNFNPHCLLMLLCAIAAGVNFAYARRSMTSIQQVPDSNCKMPGFTFIKGQLPHDRHHHAESPVIIYTLPYRRSGTPAPKPFATLAATSAACQEDAACGMFTSSGYIVGAYRLADGEKSFETESDILMWQTMYDCAGETMFPYKQHATTCIYILVHCPAHSPPRA
jgi:hypothetical protein